MPVDAPTYFTDPSPTAEMVRQILGAVSQFEKAGLVAKLKHGQRRSLRAIAAELAAIEHLAPSGQPYYASSIRHMLAN